MFNIFFNSDWHFTFYPAVVYLLHGQNPYQVATLHNPVWALLPLVPFALFGETAGGWLFAIFSLFTYGFVAYRLKARPWALAAFLLSPPVLNSLILGNIDALILWGFLLPAPIGLFLVLAKPQLGIGIAIYWGYVAWKEGRMRKLVITFLPVTIFFCASFAIFGNWLASRGDDVVAAYWNASLFPWSVPAGIMLLYLGLKYLKQRMAIASSPLLSPYVSFGSYSVALVGLLGTELWMITTVVALWALEVVARVRF
ncbi:MAG TPA: hypothetical protein VMJ64_08235 [Anaerolineales bacterium]|nr:hypothetical protein [Anaerolineales bacterium]